MTKVSASLVDVYHELTEREVKVLHLLAMGLTNAQIAEQLINSPRTVHVHVRSIYSKLGISSHSAVTHYAIHHRKCLDGNPCTLLSLLLITFYWLA